MIINNKFKAILSFMFIVSVLFSFDVYAETTWTPPTWIKLWGYCDGDLCPPEINDATNLVFFKQCSNANLCIMEYTESPFCGYEGEYYFDGQSNSPNGTVDVDPYGPVFNINWDIDQADCECYGKSWLVKSSGPGSGNCCGDDENESYCGPGFSSCFEGASYDNGDYNSYTCECGAGGQPATWITNSVCGKYLEGQGDCNDVIPTSSNICCGDDENETVQPGYPNICFVEEGDCYSYSDERYYNNLEYYEDKFCEDGTLTSRTKLIALQLLDVSEIESPTDYTLFCDNYQNTLNYYNYFIDGLIVTQHLGEANNLCVLRLSDQVIFGVSLNQKIELGSFIDTLSEISNCDDALGITDGQFHQCNSGTFKVWYNEGIQSVIYSNKDVNLGNINFWNKFLLFLKHPFQSIFNVLLNTFTQRGTIADYGFVNSTTEFSRIYLSKKGANSIKGIVEEVAGPTIREYLSITYVGYGDICNTMNASYESFRRQGQLGIKDLVLCDYDSGTAYIASNASMSLALWPELTAGLRP